ncbi:enhanced ethylene response protein 5 isoform X3 [Populus alba]|uniref:enhanced ethylene response protein 5 isoform X3 n=1 Tax=Populus alba TaxID=43335 RepID=UPI00158E24BD|nr:enhanced ethylene response protein 5 isoform X3 [Populus alba]
MAYLSMGEAHRRITEYLNRFSDAVSFQDGASLKQLLSVSSNSPSLLSLADSLNVFQKQDANRLIKQSDKYSQFGEITAPFFRCLQSYRIGNLLDAYHAFEKAANAFLPEFRNWESAWALEALYVIAYEIRILAERADRELASNGKSPEKLKGAGSFLMKVFGVLAGKGPKRVGALYVTCQLFKIYFKLGTVHLCRSVIRSIETARIFDFEEFPKRDKVTYMYYTGRLEVFNENFPAADHKLSYALMHCNPHHEANIRNLLYKRYGTQLGHLANEQQSPANQVTSSPSSSPALLANLVSSEKLVFPASHFFSQHQWFIFFWQSHSSCDPLTAPPMVLYSSKHHPSSVQSNSSLLMHFLCPTDSSSLTMATCHQPTMMISSNL